MKKILLILLVFLSIGVNAQFALTTDTLTLYRGGQLYYLAIQNDTLFVNSDTIVGVSTDNLQVIYDSLAVHLDTLQVHNTRISTNTTDIVARNPLVSIDASNMSSVVMTFLDGNTKKESWSHAHPELKSTATLSITELNTAPASATATGRTGEIRVTADYIYVCTATDTWKRTALTTW